jgi:hypothetical protein
MGLHGALLPPPRLDLQPLQRPQGRTPIATPLAPAAAAATRSSCRWRSPSRLFGPSQILSLPLSLSRHQQPRLMHQISRSVVYNAVHLIPALPHHNFSMSVRCAPAQHKATEMLRGALHLRSAVGQAVRTCAPRHAPSSSSLPCSRQPVSSAAGPPSKHVQHCCRQWSVHVPARLRSCSHASCAHAMQAVALMQAVAHACSHARACKPLRSYTCGHPHATCPPGAQSVVTRSYEQSTGEGAAAYATEAPIIRKASGL